MNIPHYKFIQFFVFILFLVVAGYFISSYASTSGWTILHTIGLALYAMLVVIITAKGKKIIYTKDFGYIKKGDGSSNKEDGNSNKNNHIIPKILVEKLRAMHPKDFEDFIKLLFELEEYKIINNSSWKKELGQRTPQTDGGIDLIVEKDNKKTFIQIKKNTTNPVGVGVLRSFYGAIVKKLGPDDKAMFITTSVFTKDATNFSKENNIININYTKIEEGVLSLEKDITRKEKIERFLAQIDYCKNSQYNQNMRTCPVCRAPLKWRHQGFYGCQNFYITGCDYKEYQQHNFIKNSYCK